MAIVFVSPQKKQRTFLLSLIGLLLLGILVVASYAFYPEISSIFLNVPEQQALGGSEVKINFSVIDSDAVKNLQIFEEIETEFSYIAKDKVGLQVQGVLKARGRQNAMEQLKNLELSAVLISEVDLGRQDPFVSY